MMTETGDLSEPKLPRSEAVIISAGRTGGTLAIEYVLFVGHR